MGRQWYFSYGIPAAKGLRVVYEHAYNVEGVRDGVVRKVPELPGVDWSEALLEVGRKSARGMLPVSHSFFVESSCLKKQKKLFKHIYAFIKDSFMMQN